jgi:UDP-glucose:(glucosyl)LPS beta-1,3-glucosyltransferase
MQTIKKNKITFIIPSINRNTLINSINSLLNQTNKNWECIVIYDGVDGIEFNDNRIKTIKIEKLGSNSHYHGMSGLVRNAGLDLVKTEWIGFLDDDDTLEPTYVETLFKKYSSYDFVIWKMKYPNGKVLPQGNSIKFGDVGISYCYKNKFENIRFDNNRDGEDFDFLLKLNLLTNNYIITPEVMYKINH